MPEEDWDRVFAVILKGCYLTMKHVIPIMEKQGGGSDHQYFFRRWYSLHGPNRK